MLRIDFSNKDSSCSCHPPARTWPHELQSGWQTATYAIFQILSLHQRASIFPFFFYISGLNTKPLKAESVSAASWSCADSRNSAESLFLYFQGFSSCFLFSSKAWDLKSCFQLFTAAVFHSAHSGREKKSWRLNGSSTETKQILHIVHIQMQRSVCPES